MTRNRPGPGRFLDGSWTVGLRDAAVQVSAVRLSEPITCEEKQLGSWTVWTVWTV